MPLPRNLDEITPEFVTSLLVARWPDVAIAGLRIDGQIHGTATKAHLVLEHARDTGAPSLMWLKAGYEPHSGKFGRAGIYSREPRVYQELLPQLSTRAPDCYGAAYDEAKREGIVLLEDLNAAGATIHTPESLISVDHAEAMLSLLADLHGATISARWHLDRPWLPPLFHDFFDDESYHAQIGRPETIAGLLEQPRTAAYPREIFDPQGIHDATARLAHWCRADMPQSMLHIDAHIGNSFADAEGQPGLLDWQCVGRGNWAWDVAYYLVSALDVEARRSSERDLLRAYLDRFAAAGGPSVEWDLAWEGYRTCLAWGFLAWLANPIELQPETYNAIVSTRFAFAMLDHDVLQDARGAAA